MTIIQSITLWLGIATMLAFLVDLIHQVPEQYRIYHLMAFWFIPVSFTTMIVVSIVAIIIKPRVFKRKGFKQAWKVYIEVFTKGKIEKAKEEL